MECKDCKHHVKKGYQMVKRSNLLEGSNAASKDACLKFSRHDRDFDRTKWHYITDEDYCSWGAK